MKRFRFVLWTTAVMVLAGAASAQDFPAKPIRFIVGPGPDVLARIVGQKLTDAWGQQILVDQRPGAGGIIAAETVAKSPADGYTMLLSTGTYTTIPSLYKKVPYDFVRDLQPVTLLATLPFLLVAHPSVPANNVQQLIQLARAHPGQLNYASSGNGTTAHLAGEMLKSMAKINIVHVPYKGTVPGVTDLVAGQVHIMFAIIQSSLPYVQAGRLKALAVSSAKRAASAPQVPTIAESGLPGYEFISWNGVHLPAATPRPVAGKLNTELLRIIALPDVKEKMLGLGMDIAGGTPEEFGALVKSDIAKWAKVIREAGIHAE
ncbi:MAG TPA: tripartite tricarboxylate transporter substrate binding protein [Burkholderiales bacterium]|nr:tripartite tricarboxylate transporter substrate binding protein [Burkholderiales bacterium]